MQANERVSYIANRPNPASGKVVKEHKSMVLPIKPASIIYKGQM